MNHMRLHDTLLNIEWHRCGFGCGHTCVNTTVRQVYVGNLTVPLSPHAEDADETPHIDLLVIMTIPNSVADVSKLI